MTTRKGKQKRLLLIRRKGILLAVVLLVAGCYLRDARLPPVRPERDRPPAATVILEATGYCPCGECCGWHRNWWGRPTYSGGPSRGQKKHVGITASGVPAKHGTIAADTTLYPFGTVMYVPGYGYGIVEDRGSDIQGQRIDLYFRTHRQAESWGRQPLEVQVWPAAGADKK